MDFDNQRMYLAHSSEEGAEECGDAFSSSEISNPGDGIVPIILSGGGGSRLWPFSTQDTPKQFLPLINNKNLFEEALERVRDPLRFSPPIVVGNARHAELCAGALAPYGDAARLLLEPCPRNTAPAIIMAAFVAREMYGDRALLLVMPSDHIIEDVEAFHQAVLKGEKAARIGKLVTFGVQPTAPETGYGYLQMGKDVQCAPGVKEVLRFVEKPEAELAEDMVLSGDHLWNAVIFLFECGLFLDEAVQSCPEIACKAQEAAVMAEREGNRIIANAAIFKECPSDSIDYAVMERSSRVAVVPMAPGWSDLGSWDALASLRIGTEPTGPITTVDCESCYIHSDGVQVAALGVRDLIIVVSGGRLLIMPRGRSQEVKRLLSAMDSMAA